MMALMALSDFQPWCSRAVGIAAGSRRAVQIAIYADLCQFAPILPICADFADLRWNVGAYAPRHAILRHTLDLY